MYIVINKTTGEETAYQGDFPNVTPLLKEGYDIIILSLYSNTIKIPRPLSQWNKYTNIENNWKEYPLPMDILKLHFKLLNDKLNEQ